MMNIIFRSSATFSGPIALQGRLRWRPAIGQWDFSREIAIPSARISLGYVTNAAERQLLIQEDYQKKLAQGIAEAINEVYTNTQ